MENKKLKQNFSFFIKFMMLIDAKYFLRINTSKNMLSQAIWAIDVLS